MSSRPSGALQARRRNPRTPPIPNAVMSPQEARIPIVPCLPSPRRDGTNMICPLPRQRTSRLRVFGALLPACTQKAHVPSPRGAIRGTFRQGRASFGRSTPKLLQGGVCCYRSDPSEPSTIPGFATDKSALVLVAAVCATSADGSPAFWLRSLGQNRRPRGSRRNAPGASEPCELVRHHLTMAQLRKCLRNSSSCRTADAGTRSRPAPCGGASQPATRAQAPELRASCSRARAR
jgi:hypothetical protein